MVAVNEINTFVYVESNFLLLNWCRNNLDATTPTAVADLMGEVTDCTTDYYSQTKNGVTPLRMHS